MEQNGYLCKIYYLQCSCCDKKYVGSTKDKKGLCSRFYNHKTDMKTGNSKLYTHMKEVGKDKFTIHLIREVFVKDFDFQRMEENKDMIIMDTINNGFNERIAYADEERKHQQKLESDKRYRTKNDNETNKIIYNAYRKDLRDNSTEIYECKTCNYKTNRKDSLARHNKGVRHLSKVNDLPVFAFFSGELSF
jgi:hypothetical protein